MAILIFKCTLLPFKYASVDPVIWEKRIAVKNKPVEARITQPPNILQNKNWDHSKIEPLN